MIDTKMLREKQKFKEIHDSWVIFITENDVLGAGHSLYHIERIVQETGECFGDGSHITYVNGSYIDDSDPIGNLMHDFRCTNAVDMFYPVLADQVRYFKETEGGRKIMSEIFEELAEKRAEKIAEQRAEQTRIETLFYSIKSLMQSMKLTAEQAMAAMNVSESDQVILRTKF